MIGINVLRDLLQQGLNKSSGDLIFDIGTNVKEFNSKVSTLYRDSGKIQGVIRTLSGKFQPIKEVRSANIVLIMELLVSQNDVDKVENILNNYIQINVGETTEFEGYSWVINFDMPTIGSVDIMSIGCGVPMQVVVYYSLVSNGVLSNKIKITINDEVLPVIQAGINRTKVCSTDNYNYAPEMQSFAEQQGLSVSVKSPYMSSGIVKQLVNDILSEEAINKTYALYYDDGCENIVNETVLISSSSVNMENGLIASVDFVFMRALDSEVV